MAFWWEEEGYDPFETGSDSEPTTSSNTAETEEDDDFLSWWSSKQSGNVSEIHTEPVEEDETPDSTGFSSLDVEPAEPVKPVEAMTAEEDDSLDWMADTKMPEREDDGGLFGALKKFAKKVSGEMLGMGQNTGISLSEGVVDLAESGVGLADIVSKGKAGKLVEDHIGDFENAHEFLAEFYTEESKAKKKELAEKEGFLDTVGAYMANPGEALQVFTRSIPSMVAGPKGVDKLAKLSKVTKGMTPVAKAVIGESLIAAGSQAEGTRQQTETGELTIKQVGTSIGTGLGTGVIGLAGGRLAKKMGITDIDTFFAGGKGTINPITGIGPVKKASQVTARILAGGISEGAFEELPQSAQETIWMNAALGKPLMEGVPENMAAGLVVGGIGGGGINLVTSVGKNPETVKPTEVIEEMKLEGVDEIDLEDGKKLADAEANLAPDADADVVSDTTAELDEPFQSNLRGADKTAMDQGKPIIEVDTDGKLVRKKYDSAGRVTGREVISEAPAVVTTPVQDAATAHLSKDQTGPGKTTINIPEILGAAEQMVEGEVTVDEIVQGMEALIRPSTAQEAAEVFEQEQQPEPKSARESAEVFAENEAQMNALIAEAEAGNISTEQVTEALIQEEVKSAEQSAGVFTEATQEYIAELDDAQKTAAEGNQQKAIEDIKRAVKRKGKNAEKSAKILETAPEITPEQQRVIKAKKDFEEALKKESSDEVLEAAAVEINESLVALEKSTGTQVQEEVQIDEPIEEAEPLQPIQRDEDAEVYFDEATGTPEIKTSSPEDIIIQREEQTERAAGQAPAPTRGTQTPVRAAIDPQVAEKVESNQGQKLTQALLDGDVKKAKRILGKFPRAARQKAFAEAESIAKELALEAGVYDLDTVVGNIEDIRPHSAARSEGGTEGPLKITPDKEIPRVWRIENTKNRKTYDVFASGRSYFVKETGQGKPTEEFDSKQEAFDAIKRADVEYTVKKDPNAGPSNRWVVVDSEGDVVPAIKRGKGEGYKTEKAAQADADKENGFDVAPATTPKKKKTYSKEITDFAEGKGRKKPKAPKKDVKGSKRPVTRIRKKTDARVLAEPNVQQRASEGSSRVSKKLSDLSIDPYPSDKATSESFKELEKLGIKGFIKKHGGESISDTFDLLESILPEGIMEEVDVELIRESGPGGSPGQYRTKLDMVFVWSHAPNGKPYNPQYTAATLLHEIVHAVTYRQLEFEPEIKTRLDNLRKDIASRLSPEMKMIHATYDGDAEGFNQVWKSLGLSAPDARFMYALLSNDELLANATHPTIKARLEGIDAPQSVIKRWLKTISDSLKTVLGLTDAGKSAFDVVMGSIAEINEEAEIEFDHDFEIEVLNEMVSDDGEFSMDALEKHTTRILEQQAEDANEAPLKIGQTEGSTWKDRGKYSADTFKNLAGGINDRLEMIHPSLAFKMRQTEANILRTVKKSQIALSNFERSLKKHFVKHKTSKEAQDMFTLGIFNGDAKILRHVLESGTPELRKTWNAVQKMRKEVEQQMLETAIISEDQIVVDYLWHREVADLEGLRKHMQRDAAKDGDVKEVVDALEQEFKKAVPALMEGAGMTEDEAKAHITERVLRTGRFTVRGRKAKGSKNRRIITVPPRYLQYYKPPFESMANHFEEAAEQINIRKLLGTSPFKAAQKKIQVLARRVERETNPEAKKDLQMLLAAEELKVLRAKENLKDGVATYVNTLVDNGTISEDDRRVVVDLINARVAQVGIKNRLLAGVRNAGLAVALGHFVNTFTQLKDGSLIMYRHGVIRSVGALVQTLAGKNDLTATDYDLQRVMNEFRTGKYFDLNKLFKLTGFQQVDQFMKTVSLQAHHNAMKKWSKDPDKFRAKFEVKWGKELTDQILKDIKAGNITEDVKTAALAEVSRDVPVFLSEMSKIYNLAGNGRIFFTLKSYALKIVNIFMRDSMIPLFNPKSTKKQRVQALYQGARLLFVLALMGAGVEELKDLVFNRNTSAVDNAVDEMLAVFMLNKYTISQGSQRGMASGLLENFTSMPVVGMFDAMQRAMTSGGEDTGFVRYIPIPGVRMGYNWFSKGFENKALTNERANIFKHIKKDFIRKGSLSRKTRDKIANFNKELRKSGSDAKPITYETLKRNRKRYMKEKANKKSLLPSLGSVGNFVGISEAFASASVVDPTLRQDVRAMATKEKQDIVIKHTKRLGVDYETGLVNMNILADLISYAESRHDPKAANPESTARGLYQFLEGSIDEAIKRTARMIGMKPWMKQAMQHRDASKLTREQQTLLFLGNALEQSGSDKYLAKVMANGDINAMTEYYYKLHHSAPDEATRRNWELSLKKVLNYAPAKK